VSAPDARRQRFTQAVEASAFAPPANEHLCSGAGQGLFAVSEGALVTGVWVVMPRPCGSGIVSARARPAIRSSGDARGEQADVVGERAVRELGGAYAHEATASFGEGR
jgi:hypothetical protein